MKNFPSLSDPSFQITHLVLVIKYYIKYRLFNLYDQATTKKGWDANSRPIFGLYTDST